MAKLSGVKTLDMVNGEITKVAYDGAEYEKIAHDFGNAQTGDLFLNTVNGDYYEITIRESNFHGISHPVRFINDIGRDDGYMRACSVHPLFRKISADKPKRLTVGDYAKVIANDSSHLAEIGDIVRIISDDHDEQPYRCERVSDEKRVGWLYESELEAYKRELKTEYIPQKGDIVVVTDDSASTHDVGDIGKITEVDYGTYRVTVPGMPDRGNWLLPTRFRKATPAEVKKYEEAAVDTTFKVGDYVKLVKSLRDNNGAICVIEDKLQHLGGVTLRHISGKFPNTKSFATYDQIELATEAEVAAAKKPKLKSGDFIKFAEDGLDITAGKVYKVQQDSDGDFYVLDDYGSKDYRIGRGYDYEIAPALEVKWASIGRAVNEYRVGDIVRLVNGDGGGLIGYDGIITKIIEDDGTSVPYRLEKPDYVESMSDTWYRAEDFVLIATVESTLN